MKEKIKIQQQQERKQKKYLTQAKRIKLWNNKVRSLHTE